MITLALVSWALAAVGLVLAGESRLLVRIVTLAGLVAIVGGLVATYLGLRAGRRR